MSHHILQFHPVVNWLFAVEWLKIRSQKPEVSILFIRASQESTPSTQTTDKKANEPPWEHQKIYKFQWLYVNYYSYLGWLKTAGRILLWLHYRELCLHVL